MGVDGPLVRLHDGGSAMARCALARLCVVLCVAPGAGADGVNRRQADRHHVTARAGECVVLLMLELNGPSPPVLLRHCNGNLDRHRRGELVILMA
jgi:hypothetical protein